MQNETKKKSRGQAFFRFVMNLTESDKGRAAALRRADNPSTEYQSWEHFATFGIDLGKPYERLPYGLIAAAIVKAKLKKNISKVNQKKLNECAKQYGKIATVKFFKEISD